LPGFGNVAEGLLTREDKEALLLVRRLTQLVQAAVPNSSDVDSSANVDIREFFRAALVGQPMIEELVPSIAPGANTFARRFAERLASRALLRLAGDVERAAGVSYAGGLDSRRAPPSAFA